MPAYARRRGGGSWLAVRRCTAASAVAPPTGRRGEKNDFRITTTGRPVGRWKIQDLTTLQIKNAGGVGYQWAVLEDEIVLSLGDANGILA